jgi:hypothetical protein
MANRSYGEKVWFIPDGYIPPTSSGSLESHESICVLNCGEEEANLEITVYFEDRDPIEKMKAVVPPLRTSHIRTSTLQGNGEFIPKGVPYAIKVESSVPVIVQYSRLDTTQAENALMTAIGFPGK